MCLLFQIFESTKPLRIGFYLTDGFVQAVPACERAVLMAKAALEKRGHTVSTDSNDLLIW